MRYLFLSEFLPKWNSGAEGSLLSIGDALQKRGNTVDYLWREDTPGRLVHPRLYEHFTLPNRQLGRVHQALLRAKYDAVVVSQPYSYRVYEELVPRFPDTIFLNRTHGWEQRLAESSDRLGWRKPASFTAPLRRASRMLLNRACERTAKACSGIIAGSELCAKYIRTQYSLGEKPIAVVPYGVDPNLLWESLKQDPGNSPKLLFVGQYLPRKGSTVLESNLPLIAKDYPRAKVTFVVPEESISAVGAAFRPCFGDRLDIRSWTSRENLASIYREHNILLFPSLFEGFGKVFLEGMASGLCVVGFREGGLPDVALHGRDALICDAGDGDAFRHLLSWAIQNPDRTEAIGQRAREVARKFTWDRHARDTEEFCWQVKLGVAKESMVS